MIERNGKRRQANQSFSDELPISHPCLYHCDSCGVSLLLLLQAHLFLTSPGFGPYMALGTSLTAINKTQCLILNPSVQPAAHQQKSGSLEFPSEALFQFNNKPLYNLCSHLLRILSGAKHFKLMSVYFALKNALMRLCREERRLFLS